ncbi:hypothetical protein TTHERM_00522410 (macronuclear) [Tetrahymena thermophila SB210]|uniref:Uncharacterized protein n=1 Tax=Tetrahymena thermophila (strain SB210) TaxID=312017 RepID=I7M7L5_TETTS|nr:hypothetical protein TTHERM_00522410 [Tetrahymena thermophila SB210]EAR94174.2 hypothetical protein TTHERM_00522410 [Tetrahymena thermophila SB210]|eukprot:XP_001014419.2 hypothetical protein TTHERM_00522410 [Tetrahymena thermophila SB210]
MSGSQEEQLKAFYDQLDRFNSFWIKKRIFSRWKEHFVDTKQRIQKIIKSMDLNEQWILRYHLQSWKKFVLIQHQKRATKLRKIQLAKRVINRWRNYIARNKYLTLFKYFNLMRKDYVENKIKKVIMEKKNYKILKGYFQLMKDYSIHSFQKEINMHEKCLLLYKRNLKKKYFNSLKLSAKIKRDVEYMRSTALESRRFYIFKAFFQPWKEITQKRKINRCCFLILQQQQNLKRKQQIFYTWIHSSIKNYQVRVFSEKNLMFKYFKILQSWYLKQSKKKYQLQYFTNKKVNGLKKLILLEWFQYANRKVTREKKCEAYLLKKQIMLLEKSFQAFKSVCDKQIRKEKLIYLSMKHYQITTLKKYFESWALYLDQNQRQYLNKLEAYRHSEKMLQRLYFKTFKILLQKKKFLRDVEAQIELRKIQRDRQSIFQFMKSQMQQNYLIQKKVLERYQYKKLSSTFQELISYSKKQKQKKIIIKQNIMKLNFRLIQKTFSSWAFRSNQNKLPRYQKLNAQLFKQTKQYSKFFQLLKKKWIRSKIGKFIQQKKQSKLQESAFHLWRYLKIQEERINSNLIQSIINKSYKMFFILKEYAIKKKKQREIINFTKQKRNYRIQKLGWSVWKFFLRLKDEKNMYKMSLLRYALSKKAKKMLEAWGSHVSKRKNLNELSLKVQLNQQKWRKMMLLRILKEGAKGQLDFINFIKQYRMKNNLKTQRKAFQILTQYAEKKNIIKRIIQSNREAIQYRQLQNILVEWQYYIQRKKRDQLKLEEHISFKQCVQISKVIKYWRRLTKVLAKENNKIAIIQNNTKKKMEFSYFYQWCEVYQEKRFREQTDKMQQFLEKRVAFNLVMRALRRQVDQKNQKINTDAFAINHYIQNTYKKIFESLQYFKQESKRKKGLEIMSNLLAKAISFKRVVKKFKVAKNYSYHRKHCFKYYITKLYHKCFYILKQYQSFRENQRKLALKQFQSLQLQKLQKCFQYLKRNVDIQMNQRIFKKKFEKKKTLRLKKLSMLIWKDYYIRKRFINTKIREFRENTNQKMLRQAFIELHSYRLNKTYMKKCKQTAELFNINRIKKGYFNSWKITCDEEKYKIRQSNLAFRHYSFNVLVKSLRQWIRYIQREKIENNQTYNGVALRSIKLKQYAFQQLKKNYTLQTKSKIAKANHNVLTKAVFLRKWKRVTIKNKLSKPAIQTINNHLSIAIKRVCFDKIRQRSQKGDILQKIARIYNHNLNYNVLKAFLVNMLLQRRIEIYQLRRNFQTTKIVFSILKQYAEIKKKRVQKVVHTLQNIHGMIQYNLAQKVFYALKQYHYMKVLKRNTLIRYMNQLKLKTFLSFRKYVLEVHEQGPNESRIAAVHI